MAGASQLPTSPPRLISHNLERRSRDSSDADDIVGKGLRSTQRLSDVARLHNRLCLELHSEGPPPLASCAGPFPSPPCSISRARRGIPICSTIRNRIGSLMPNSSCSSDVGVVVSAYRRPSSLSCAGVNPSPLEPVAGSGLSAVPFAGMTMFGTLSSIMYCPFHSVRLGNARAWTSLRRIRRELESDLKHPLMVGLFLGRLGPFCRMT